MARPRIIRETKRAIVEREPPAQSTLHPHEWLSEESRSEYGRVLKSKSPFALYLSSLASEKIRNHAVREAQRQLEVMGFLVGEACRWKSQTYTMVKDVVTTALKSSPSKVRFDSSAFPKLFADLDRSGFDYVLVGWYHSHPGHTCFLSKTDLETQRTMFDQPFHAALVIDPVNEDVKTFKLIRDGYEEVPFAVFEPRVRNANKVRSRRLKVRPVALG